MKKLRLKIGIDIAEVPRFERVVSDSKSRFLKKVFRPREIKYCSAMARPAMHFAGTFAAKEAVFKALGRNDILFSSIEIRRGKNGSPTVWIDNKRRESVQVSISHTAKVAIAIALRE